VTLIHVPRPPKSAMNTERPVSSLLKNQIEHLHLAEQRLPLHFRSRTYVNAIKTHAEAADYCREVTEAILNAHQEATARRAGRVVEIAAAAEKQPTKGPRPVVGKKTAKKKRANKKGAPKK